MVQISGFAPSGSGEKLTKSVEAHMDRIFIPRGKDYQFMVIERCDDINQLYPDFCRTCLWNNYISHIQVTLFNLLIRFEKFQFPEFNEVVPDYGKDNFYFNVINETYPHTLLTTAYFDEMVEIANGAEAEHSSHSPQNRLLQGEEYLSHSLKTKKQMLRDIENAFKNYKKGRRQ